MKRTCYSKKIHFITVLGASIAQLGAIVQTSAQTPTDYLRETLAQVVAKASVLDLADYDYYSAGRNSLFGVVLEEGESHSLRAPFTRGVEYVIIGAGDSDVLDLDIQVQDSEKIIASDRETDAGPVIQFTPEFSGRLSIKITNHKGRRRDKTSEETNPGFVSFVILEQSNTENFSLVRLSEALDNITSIADDLPSQFFRGFPTGTFCLFGGQVNEGRDTYIFNTSPEPGSYAFVAAGSDNIMDVDVTVERQRAREDIDSTTVVCRDESSDRAALCTFQATQNQYYLTRIKNYRGGSGFVFSVLTQAVQPQR